MFDRVRRGDPDRRARPSVKLLYTEFRIAGMHLQHHGTRPVELAFSSCSTLEFGGLMLDAISDMEGRVLTVYSSEVAVGGVTASHDDDWYWAIFALRATDLRAGDQTAPLGGAAGTREAALIALEDRWNVWLESAGLTYSSRRPV